MDHQLFCLGCYSEVHKESPTMFCLKCYSEVHSHGSPTVFCLGCYSEVHSMDQLLIIPPFVYSPCCFNLLTKNTICDDKLSCACFVLFVVPDCCKIIWLYISFCICLFSVHGYC